jgi:hypothetical protein
MILTVVVLWFIITTVSIAISMLSVDIANSRNRRGVVPE